MHGGRIVEEGGERSRYPLGGLRRDEEAGHPVDNGIVNPADIRRDHGASRSHRLDDGVGEPLVERAEDRNVEQGVWIRTVWTMAGEMHSVSDPELSGQRLE